MSPNLEIVNFSFRNGIFCINLKDCIGNYHSVPFETGYLKNDINNFQIKAMHGFAEEYIGHIHVFMTDFIGLYQILEKRKFEFISKDNIYRQFTIDIISNPDKAELIITQYSDLLYAIIYYPVNNIHKINDGTELDESISCEYLNCLRVDEIFENNISNTYQYFDYYFAKEGYDRDIINEGYDFRTEEEREYDSIIDDDDAKRDGFPDLWLNEQIGKANAKEIWEEKQKEIDENKKLYDEVIARFKEIKLINYDKSYYTTGNRPIVKLLLPPILIKQKCSQVVNIKLYKKYFHGINYYRGREGNIIVYDFWQEYLADAERPIIDLDSFRKEMGVDLMYAITFEFNYDNRIIYIDISELDDLPNENVDDLDPFIYT